jgi:hypothetical protein
MAFCGNPFSQTRKNKKYLMDNIIVYVDDAAYALQMLQPMRLVDIERKPAR